MQRSALSRVAGRIRDGLAERIDIDIEDRQPLTLSEFIKAYWSMLEPATLYLHNWHIDAICDHLTAVTNGDLRKLVINVPPGFMKSLSVCVFWPAWEWAEVDASTRWLFSSYSDDFAMRDSRKTRDLIRSKQYQEAYGHRVHVRRDRDGVKDFHNDRTGFRKAVGVEGGGTGERADRIVTDDPHKITEIDSAVRRDAVVEWWRSLMTMRGADPRTSTHVIIMQRLHERDIAAVAVEDLGYECLRIPNEFEPSARCATSIGWSDPRTELDELAWPERFDAEETAAMKISLRPRGYAGQAQQRPTPIGGLMFRREWFRVIGAPPANVIACRSWDLAGTEARPGADPSFTAGVLVLRDLDTQRLCIADLRHFRASPGVVEGTVKNVATADGKRVGIVIEQEPGSSGKALIAHYVARVLAGWRVRGERPTGPKVTRWEIFAAQAEVGNVDVVRGEWNEVFFAELEAGPAGAHDDIKDAASQGVSEVLERQLTTTELWVKAMANRDTNSDGGVVA